jgi:sec-independent protein translocase protein TatA
MFRQFGGGEILLILAVVLLLFGARKLPDLARSLGASAKEFRKGIDEGTEEQPAEEQPAEEQPAADSSGDPKA